MTQMGSIVTNSFCKQGTVHNTQAHSLSHTHTNTHTYTIQIHIHRRKLGVGKGTCNHMQVRVVGGEFLKANRVTG